MRSVRLARQVARLCVSQHSNALNAVPAFAVQWKGSLWTATPGVETAWEAVLKPGYHCTAMPATFETAADLNAAVNAWVLDPTVAELSTAISGWTSRASATSELFGAKQAFNDDIGGWDTSSVSNLDGTFWSPPFDRYIGGWDTSKVKTMRNTFNSARCTTGGSATGTRAR